jgi:hypothetical protein
MKSASGEQEKRGAAEPKEFGELLRYTAAGYAGGLMVGFILDQLGFQRSAIGQWRVRTLSGEGESIFEGIFAVRPRLAGKVGSMADAYGWGKLLGMIFPWMVDAGSRIAGGRRIRLAGLLHPLPLREFAVWRPTPMTAWGQTRPKLALPDLGRS